MLDQRYDNNNSRHSIEWRLFFSSPKVTILVETGLNFILFDLAYLMLYTMQCLIFVNHKSIGLDMSNMESSN